MISYNYPLSHIINNGKRGSTGSGMEQDCKEGVSLVSILKWNCLWLSQITKKGDKFWK